MKGRNLFSVSTLILALSSSVFGGKPNTTGLVYPVPEICKDVKNKHLEAVPYNFPEYLTDSNGNRCVVSAQQVVYAEENWATLNFSPACGGPKKFYIEALCYWECIAERCMFFHIVR